MIVFHRISFRKEKKKTLSNNKNIIKSSHEISILADFNDDEDNFLSLSLLLW